MNAGDQSDNTPLHLAASEGRTKTAQQLVEYGSYLEPINRWAQNTPLGEALLYGHTETADALRALGAVNESVSFLETERKRCRGGDDHRVCENATTDCPNFGENPETWCHACATIAAFAYWYTDTLRKMWRDRVARNPGIRSTR